MKAGGLESKHIKGVVSRGGCNVNRVDPKSTESVCRWFGM